METKGRPPSEQNPCHLRGGGYRLALASSTEHSEGPSVSVGKAHSWGRRRTLLLHCRAMLTAAARESRGFSPPVSPTSDGRAENGKASTALAEAATCYLNTTEMENRALG